MSHLTFEQIQDLRSDPRNYWNRAGEIIPKVDYNRLLKILIKDEKILKDFFVIEMPRPNEPGAIMMEKFSEFVTSHFRKSDTLSDKANLTYNERAREIEGLPQDFTPSDKVIEYGRHLLIENDKPKITQLELDEFKKYAMSLKVGIILGVEQDKAKQDKFWGKFGDQTVWGHGECLYWFDIVDVIIAPDLTLPKGLSAFVPFDYIKVDKNKPESVSVINLRYTQNILKFPDEYKEKNIKLLSGLQHYSLSSKGFKEIKISFRVIDKDKRICTYEVENIPDMISEFKKISWILQNGSSLPYEVIKSEIKL